MLLRDIEKILIFFYALQALGSAEALQAVDGMGLKTQHHQFGAIDTGSPRHDDITEFVRYYHRAKYADFAGQITRLVT